MNAIVSCFRSIPARSISSLSSSVRSESCEGLLATAPEGTTGMTMDDFLRQNNASPKYRTYSMQPFSAERGYDKDFDPFIFGGRPIPLSKVDEYDHVWSLGDTSDNQEESVESVDPSIIATHDFI